MRWNGGTCVVFAAASILALAAGVGLSQERSKPAGAGFVDVHLHLKEGGWKQGGGRPQRNGQARDESGYEVAAKSLLEHMDRHGVAKGLLMPPPRDPQRKGESETPGLLEVARRYPDRLFVAAGGFELNPIIHETAPAKVTPELRVRFEREAERILADGAKAFGEMTALHLSFFDQHAFEECPPDHPLFLLLADIAARHDVPIDLHMEAVPKDMPLPPGFDRVSPNNPATLQANIPGLERLLAHERKARIVWQHIGWDNTGCMTVGLLRRLLAAHSNLFLALRVEERGRSMGGTPMPNRIVDRAGQIVPEWLDLLQEFPDRFVIGTDEFFCPPGGGKSPPQSFEETWNMVGQLPAELAAKIGRENAERIYRL